MSLEELPIELVCEILHFAIDPHHLISNVLSILHTSKSWYVHSQDETFWHAILQPYRSHQLHHHDYNDSEREHFFRTHEFISSLLESSHRNKLNLWHNDTNEIDDDFYQVSFHEKADEWIEAYAHGEENVVLKILMEIALGHEMIEHVGMKSIGVVIQAFFHHLFMPAMLTVKEWTESGQKRTHVAAGSVLNDHLVRFIKSKSILNQEMVHLWNDMDALYFTIPRQYL